MKNLAGRVVGGLERTSLLGGQETLHAFYDGEFRSTVIPVSFYAKGGVHQLTMVCTQQDSESENSRRQRVNERGLKACQLRSLCSLHSVRPLSTYLM